MPSVRLTFTLALAALIVAAQAGCKKPPSLPPPAGGGGAIGPPPDLVDRIRSGPAEGPVAFVTEAQMQTTDGRTVRVPAGTRAALITQDEIHAGVEVKLEGTVVRGYVSRDRVIPTIRVTAAVRVEVPGYGSTEEEAEWEVRPGHSADVPLDATGLTGLFRWTNRQPAERNEEFGRYSKAYQGVLAALANGDAAAALHSCDSLAAFQSRPGALGGSEYDPEGGPYVASRALALAGRAGRPRPDPLSDKVLLRAVEDWKERKRFVAGSITAAEGLLRANALGQPVGVFRATVAERLREFQASDRWSDERVHWMLAEAMAARSAIEEAYLAKKAVPWVEVRPQLEQLLKAHQAGAISADRLAILLTTELEVLFRLTNTSPIKVVVTPGKVWGSTAKPPPVTIDRAWAAAVAVPGPSLRLTWHPTEGRFDWAVQP